MITEKEYGLLVLVKNHPFLKKEDFLTNEEFDYACELARELLEKGLITSNANEPFMRNSTGQGSQYQIAGKFHLSTAAREIVSSGSYSIYKKSQPKNSQWSLEHRLAALSIIVAILGVLVALFYSH